MKVVGVGRSSGDYEGYKYDNFVLHCTEVPDDRTFTGLRCVMVKVKASVFLEQVMPLVDGDVSRLLGLTISVSYDRFGKVQRVDITPEPVKK